MTSDVSPRDLPVPAPDRGARWLDLARNYADALRAYGTDHYGPVHTPMWVQMIDLRTLAIPAQETAEEWARETATWDEDRGYDRFFTAKHGLLFAGMANFNLDGSNVRLMNALGRLTGDSAYPDAARACMEAFFERCVSPATGLFAWGLHMAYDVRRDEPGMRWHELGMWDPAAWAEMLALNCDVAETGIRAIWRWHVHDKRTYAFDRKAEFFNAAYTHETQAFWHHAPIYAEAFLDAWRATGNSDFRRWAVELIESIWYKRDPETYHVAGNWTLERERFGEIQRYDDYTWPMEYLQRAYERTGERWLVDIADEYLVAKGSRPPITERGEKAREARVVLRSSRMRRNEDFLRLVAGYAATMPAGIDRPIMAFDAAHALILLVELFETTGDAAWLAKARAYAESAREAFVHESGLIAGAVGLRRPRYYDSAHGSGMLATAFYRLGLVEAGLAPYDVRANGHGEGYPHHEPPIDVTCRFLGDGPARAELVLERGVASGHIAHIDGVPAGDEWRFAIPAEAVGGDRLVRFRILPDGRDAELEPTWRYIWIGRALPPLVLGELALGAPPAAGAEIAVSVFASDPGRVVSAEARVLVDDAFGYAPAPLERRGSRFEGRLRLPDGETPLRITVVVRAIDAGDPEARIEGPPRTYRVVATDTLADGTPGARTGVIVTGVSKSVATRSLPQATRYWWWPDEHGEHPPIPLGERTYAIAGTGGADAALSIPYEKGEVARFVGNTRRLVRRTGNGWHPVATEIDAANSRLVVRGRGLDGVWAIGGDDRLLWRAGSAENNCATILDIDGDGRREIVTGAGGHGAQALSAAGKVLWNAFLGEPFHPGGGTFSHVAAWRDGDGVHIVLGSEDGSVRCLDAGGAVRWRYVAHGEVRSGIAVSREKLLAFTDRVGHVHVVDMGGNRVWERKIASECHATPCWADIDGDGRDELLCGTRDGELVVLRADGARGWTATLDGQVATPAVGAFSVEGGDLSIVAGTSTGLLVALDAHGQRMWSVETPRPDIDGWNEPDVTLADIDGDGVREVVMASRNQCVHAFDSSGRERWTFATGGQIVGAVAYARLSGGPGVDLVVGSGAGTTHILDGAGREVWMYAQRGVDWHTHANVADVDGDGRLEIVMKSGSGNCLLRTDVACPPFAMPWATYRGNLARTGVA